MPLTPLFFRLNAAIFPVKRHYFSGSTPLPPPFLLFNAVNATLFRLTAVNSAVFFLFIAVKAAVFRDQLCQRCFYSGSTPLLKLFLQFNAVNAAFFGSAPLILLFFQLNADNTVFFQFNAVKGGISQVQRP